MTVREPDPDDLTTHERPAVVDVEEQGIVFVAHASVDDPAWLRVREWNGTTVKIPRHRVKQLRYLPTERYGDRDENGRKSKRIADEHWREKARNWTAGSSNGHRPVVADD